MRRLLIFNPDTDYALACNSEFYKAPKSVRNLASQLSLLPALYASDGDVILIPADAPDDLTQLRYYPIVRQKGIFIVYEGDSLPAPEEDFVPEPWGWNPAIRRFLLDRYPDLAGIPDKESIAVIRELSHRRTTIAFLKSMGCFLNPEIQLPVEITDVNDALEAYRIDSRRYFKAPWSSSGRGIILTDDLEEKHVEPWVRGIIKRQGSVLMEKAYDRVFDFATEWRMNKGRAEFLGYSVFSTSCRGKYAGNFDGSKEEIKRRVQANVPGWTAKSIEIQKRALEDVVGVRYSGLLGIDMLVTKSGAVNPCVEINFRHTMGMIGLI